MRISEEMVKVLKNNILALRPDALIYLFGSRADDQKRGGDIDILVLCSQPLHWKEKLMIERAFWKQFGEQKIDILSYTVDSQEPFKNVAMLNAIEL